MTVLSEENQDKIAYIIWLKLLLNGSPNCPPQKSMMVKCLEEIKWKS